ncbi:hypothetical protein [Humidesulfovibrio idahonensis]
MKRTYQLLLCCLLAGGLLAAPGPKAACAQDGPAPQQKTGAKAASSNAPKQTAKTAAKTKKARAADKAAKARPKAAKEKPGREKPKLTKEELLSPYSASNNPQDPQNATRWQFEPSTVPSSLAQPNNDSALNLRLGQDKIVDPITGQEKKTRVDPNGAKESIKNMDLKGAMDKVGGKAEVQVEILKF